MKKIVLLCVGLAFSFSTYSRVYYSKTLGFFNHYKLVVQTVLHNGDIFMECHEPGWTRCRPQELYVKFSPASRFDFEKVKQKIKNYSTTEEKLSYLAEAKTEYLQNKPAQVPSGVVPFDEKVQLEMDLLKTQSKLSKKRQQTVTAQENKSPTVPSKSPRSPPVNLRSTPTLTSLWIFSFS